MYISKWWPLSFLRQTCSSILEKQASQLYQLRLVTSFFPFTKCEGIYLLGRSSEKYAAPQVSSFLVNTTAPMKIQPSGVNRKGLSLTPRWGIMAALERLSPAQEQSMIHEVSEIEKGIYTLGRSSDKYAAPRFSTFPLNSTAPMKIQPSVVNRKGNKRPMVGQSCLHGRVPTPRSCRSVGKG